MDRLEAMSLLVTVSELGSLSAAGRKLGIALPSVSRRISDLEAQLKTQLLVRTTRKLSLTDAGEVYVAAVRRILEQVADAERVAGGEYSSPRGELAISAPIVFGRLHVLPLVCAFLAQYPEIDIRLSLSDRNAQLVDDHIDVALRIGALPDSRMQALRVGSVRRVVCGSPAYFAAHGIPKVPADLAKHAVVSFDALGGQTWNFSSGGGKSDASVQLHARLVVNTAEAAIDGAIAGVGVTRVLSYQAASAVADGTLKIVLAGYEPEAVPVSLLHAGQGQVPRKTRAFLDFASTALRKRLGHKA